MSDLDLHENGDSPDGTVDMSKYKGHFALAGKKKGSSSELLGNVCLVGFLVIDRSTTWKDSEIETMKNVLKMAADSFMEQSGLRPNRLHVSYAFDIVPLQYKYERYNDYNGETPVVTDVLKQYGYDNVADYTTHYKGKFEKKEAPLVFFINRDFRSYESTRGHGEYCFVSYRDDVIGCVRTLMHEVLHQFGAIDYYLPDSVKSVAEELFPESIMLHGNQIDDLTRYIIGWDKNPSETALQFLDATADVTQADVDRARDADSDNDW